jgi:hypothetical protein
MNRSCPVAHLFVEEECSFFTQGAYWCYGTDGFVVGANFCVPIAVANRYEKGNGDALHEWLHWLTPQEPYTQI